MNKKILLHIGYPKTATTTFQEHVFKNLHQTGKINYLGRNSIKSNKFEGEDYAIELRKKGLFDKSISCNYTLHPRLLNVISDENLLMLNSINKIQYKSESDWKHMLNTVFSLIEDFEIEILVTLRKQSDLIFSLFVQKYKFLYAEKTGVNFENFVFHEKSRVLKSEFDMYNFDELDDFLTSKNFKVNYLLFEDLYHDKSSISSDLKNVLNQKKGALNGYLDAQYRLKKIENHKNLSYMVSVKKSILKHLFYQPKFNYISKNIFEKLVNRLLFRNYEKPIEKPSQNIIKNIDKYFQYSNKRFFDRYPDLKERANNYEYF